MLVAWVSAQGAERCVEGTTRSTGGGIDWLLRLSFAVAILKASQKRLLLP